MGLNFACARRHLDVGVAVIEMPNQADRRHLIALGPLDPPDTIAYVPRRRLLVGVRGTKRLPYVTTCYHLRKAQPPSKLLIQLSVVDSNHLRWPLRKLMWLDETVEEQGNRIVRVRHSVLHLSCQPRESVAVCTSTLWYI